MKSSLSITLFVALTATLHAADVTGDRLNIGTGHGLTGGSATIAGGLNNTNQGYVGTISGGHLNRIEAPSGLDSGSLYNTIGGGYNNLIRSNSYRSVISGGANNIIADDAERSVIGGGDSNMIYRDAFASWIGGGLTHFIGRDSAYGSIGGGGGNLIRSNAAYATISGGWSNIVGGSSGTTITPSVIAGGWRNIIGEDSGLSTIGGGRTHLIETNSAFATIAGGVDNCIKRSSSLSTIGGGYLNTNSGIATTISGGEQNTTGGYGATVPGGALNTANGAYSLAAGYRAKANHNGSFVWGDYTGADVASTGGNQFIVRASGGIWFGGNSSPSFTAGHLIDTSSGAYLSIGGSWVNSSDRDAKENIEPVNTREVLHKVSQLRVNSWNYKAEGKAVRHIGPMAQDFAAAFSVGDDNKHISTVDADGVALAAIQGLHQLVNERDAEIRRLKKQVVALEQQVEAVQGVRHQWEARLGSIEKALAKSLGSLPVAETVAVRTD